MNRLLLVVLLLSIGIPLQAQSMQEKAWAGDPEAMMELSEAFLFGKGDIEKNEDSSAIYIKKAAEKGYPDAQYLLGLNELNSIYSATAYSRGVELVRKAAVQGHPAAQMKLAEIYSTQGTETQSDKYFSLKMAYEYAEQAAAQDYEEALRYCAEARLAGRGCTANDSIAVAMMHRAATRKRSIPAQLRMGDLAWEGKVTGKPAPFLAMKWYSGVLYHKRSNIDQRAEADMALHKIDQWLKEISNLYTGSGGVLAPGQFHYRLRE